MTHNIAKSITDQIGADRISKAIGVSSHSIRHARTEGTFPASWYAVLSDMCKQQGIECPLSAFNWKTPVSASLSKAS